MAGKRLAIGKVPNPDRLVINHFHRSLSRRCKYFQAMRPKIHIGPPTVKARVFAGWCVVDQRDRLNRKVIAQFLREKRREKC